MMSLEIQNHQPFEGKIQNHPKKLKMEITGNEINEVICFIMWLGEVCGPHKEQMLYECTDTSHRF